MTEFEHQVDEALRQCTVPAGPGRIWDFDEMVRRVAAAIEEAAMTAVTESMDFSEMPPPPQVDYTEIVAAKAAALATLRGTS